MIRRTAHFALVIAGVGDGQPVAHQRAQAGSTSPALPSSSPARMAAASCVSSAKPELGQRGGDLARGLVEQFALDDAQHVGGDAGVEVDLAARCDVGRTSLVEEVGDGGDEFGRGRPPVQPSSPGPPPSSRSSTSHSVSQTRRPIAASSTDGVWPDRWRSAWKRQMTPQRSVASVSHHRNAVAVDGRARGRPRRRDRKSSTLPRPPAPSASGAPNRQARMQNQARSS